MRPPLLRHLALALALFSARHLPLPRHLDSELLQRLQFQAVARVRYSPPLKLLLRLAVVAAGVAGVVQDAEQVLSPALGAVLPCPASLVPQAALGQVAWADSD